MGDNRCDFCGEYDRLISLDSHRFAISSNSGMFSLKRDDGIMKLAERIGSSAKGHLEYLIIDFIF